MQRFIEVNKCRVCFGEDLIEVLDLNEQPLANSYHKGEEQRRFPLKINTCTSCFHTQLGVVVDPDLMFRDYLYVSGTSKTLHKYFDDFVRICESYGVKSGKVLDIACNDGTQLDKFKKRGWQTFGVDPAENLYEISKHKHKVKCGYWNMEVSKSFNEKFNIITAQNVFAHVHDIHEFLKSCAASLENGGLVFIQTSQADMIIDNQFDTIYHEHLSFFTTKSMKTCANMNKFSLIDVKKTDIHGGSYVFVLKYGSDDERLSEEQILVESSRGFYDLETYKQYTIKCKKVVQDFSEKVQELKRKGFKVVGYGAAAKGNTFLNFADISLDYIVDDNELKQGLQTPGKNTKILSPKILSSEDPFKTVVVPLAWNFFEEIKEKSNSYTDSGFIFIKYFPTLEIIHPNID